MATDAKVSPTMVNPRDKAGNEEEEDIAEIPSKFVSKQMKIPKKYR